MTDARRLEQRQRAALRASFAKWWAPVPLAPAASLATIAPGHKARRPHFTL